MKEDIEIDLQNPEFQSTLKLIQFTRNSVFLTGKAGTGKSTLLKYICSHTRKKHVVLAPTGIAAINAGGSTLHSFFKLPFHPLLPDDPRFSFRKLKEFLKYNSAHQKLVRETELIIIDEISMTSSTVSYASTAATCANRSAESSYCLSEIYSNWNRLSKRTNEKS